MKQSTEELQISIMLQPTSWNSLRNLVLCIVRKKWIFVRTCGWHRDTQYNNNHHNDTHSSNIQYNEKQHNKYLRYENSL